MRILASLFLLILAFVVFELLSQALFFVREGDPLFAYDRAEELQEQNRLDTIEKRVGLPGVRLHPFMGFVNTGTVGGFNNAGFRDQQTFPYTSQPDEFVVGIFGGSVASNFWSYNVAFRTFQVELQALRPDIQADKVVILNFAKEAYRQPQQLATFNYFSIQGQEFDLVININGYNELTSTWFNLKNATDVAYPSINLMMEFAQLTAAKNVGTEAASRLVAKSLAERAYDQDLASAWLLMLGTSKIIPLIAAPPSNEPGSGFAYDQASNLLFIPHDPKQPTNQEIVDAFTAYMDLSSTLMAHSVWSQGAAYLEVLQPNQYVETGRTFTAEERKIAFVAPTPYEGTIDQAYRRLRKDVIADADTSWFVDGSFAVDHLDSPAYADNCCHLSQDGRSELSKFIARHAAHVLERRERADRSSN